MSKRHSSYGKAYQMLKNKYGSRHKKAYARAIKRKELNKIGRLSKSRIGETQ